MPMKALAKNSGYPFPLVAKCVEQPCNFGGVSSILGSGSDFKPFGRCDMRCLVTSGKDLSGTKSSNDVSEEDMKFVGELVKKGIVLAATVCGVLMFGCERAFAMEGLVSVMEQSKVFFRNAWPKVLPVLQIFKEQGVVLAVLLALSAFFSMAETSITTLWPWKVSSVRDFFLNILLIILKIMILFFFPLILDILTISCLVCNLLSFVYYLIPLLKCYIVITLRKRNSD